MRETALDCTAIKLKRSCLVLLESSLKANAGSEMFVCKPLSRVVGKLTKALNVDNSDVEFIHNTGADGFVLAEPTSIMLDLQLR